MAFRFRPEIESSTLPPLVFFNTTKQQTRLVPTRQGWMIELTNKAPLQKKRYAVTGTAVHVNPVHTDHLGLVNIGNRNNWLYSKCLFNDPQELEHQVKLRLGTLDDSSQYYDDPQKGRWGGQNERNGRRLSVTVTPVKDDDEWFNVHLEVTSTDATRPLVGAVTFHLHDTFDPDIERVPVLNGSAVLELIVWGAFTVGVEADDGQVQLELDMSQLPEVPKRFRER